MPITQSSARQYPLVAFVTIGYADVTDAVAENAIDIPAGAKVISADLDVTTAWNSATSDTGALAGAGVTLAATTIAAAGSVSGVSLDGSTVGAGGATITFTWDGTGAVPTAGEAVLSVTYILEDRSNENYDA